VSKSSLLGNQLDVLAKQTLSRMGCNKRPTIGLFGQTPTFPIITIGSTSLLQQVNNMGPQQLCHFGMEIELGLS
jgi:hypothetical protein